MTNAVILNECPRCGGYIHSNRDMYGKYKECLQCGYMRDIDRHKEREATSPASSRATKRVA